MTDQREPRDQPPPTWDGQQWVGAPPQPQKPAKKRRRVFLWVFLAVQAIFIIWIVTGVNASSSNTSSCGSLSAKACQDAQNAGTGIGVFLIIFLWVLVDIILGIGYGVYKLASRR